MDFTRSSQKGWSLIRKLGGAAKLSNSKPKINADRTARKLIQSSKAPSKKMFTKQIILTYRQLRRSTPMDSELSNPFSIEDVHEKWQIKRFRCNIPRISDIKWLSNEIMIIKIFHQCPVNEYFTITIQKD